MTRISLAVKFQQLRHRAIAFAVVAITACISYAQTRPQQFADAEYGLNQQVVTRLEVAGKPTRSASTAPPLAVTTPSGRRAAIDAYWGEGLPTQTKLAIFDKFWSHADQRFAAFQGIEVDWSALRERYRSEIAAGVSRGRFAAIMNHLGLALRDSHSHAYDLLVNFETIPGPGVPLLGVGGWIAEDRPRSAGNGEPENATRHSGHRQPNIHTDRRDEKNAIHQVRSRCLHQMPRTDCR